MDKIFICSPYRGDVKKNIENVKRYCSYFSYEGIPRDKANNTAEKLVAKAAKSVEKSITI
jgi:hypothetical protein